MITAKRRATGNRRAMWAAIGAMSIAGVWASPAAANPGDVLVADNGGILVAVNPLSGVQTVISSNERSTAAGGQALFTDLFGVAQEASGNFVVIARRGNQAAPPNPPPNGPSRLIRVNALNGAQSLVASDPQMTYGLTAVAVAPNGDIYFGDENYPSPGYNPGAVFKADPMTGSLSVVTSNAKSAQAGGVHHIESPLGISVTPEGGMWVLADNGGDDNAPASPNDFVGAIMQVDVATGKQTLLSTNAISTAHGGQALFTDPRAMVRAPGGDFYVVDDAALNDPAHFTADKTKVVKVDHATGAQTLVSDNATSQAHGAGRLFNRPYGIGMSDGGQLYVGDGARLLRVDPATGAQTLVSNGGSLGNAIGVTVLHGAATPGTGPSTKPPPTGSGTKKPPRRPCAGRKGKRLKKCRAAERRRQALKRCKRLKGAKRKACLRRARRVH